MRGHYDIDSAFDAGHRTKEIEAALALLRLQEDGLRAPVFDLVPYLMRPVASVSARRHELAPGRLLLHVDFRFDSGAIGTLVMGTHQSRSTPMEWWQVMSDHQRVEVRNVHEVRHYRNPPFKFSNAQASLVDGENTLV